MKIRSGDVFRWRRLHRGQYRGCWRDAGRRGRAVHVGGSSRVLRHTQEGGNSRTPSPAGGGAS